MKKIRLGLVLISLLATILVAFFACTETPPTQPVEENENICEHNFLFDSTVTSPTESAVGEVKCKCSECGREESFIAPSLSAEIYTITITEATCEEKGVKTYFSAIYGEHTVETSKKYHDYEISDSQQPTCVSDGYEEITCKLCGDVVRESVPALMHEYQVIESVEADCDDEGHDVYKCKDCESRYTVFGTEYGHKYGEGTYYGAVCPETAYTSYLCEECGYENKVYDEEPSHIYDSLTGKCTECNGECNHEIEDYRCGKCNLDIYAYMETNGYFHFDENKDGNFDVGERVYFGFFPKSAVTTKTVIDALSSITPSDGYYYYDGNKYVKSELDQKNSGIAKFNDGTLVSSNIFNGGYFYRIEPISWVVVSVESGYATLSCEQIIDRRDYLDKSKYYYANGNYYINGTSVYACAWEESDMRKYLNGDFIDYAFNEVGKSLIKLTEVDNDESNYYEDKDHANGNVTEDYIFLPSYGDLFSEEESKDDTSSDRVKQGTDYAIGNGLGIKSGDGIGNYYTRSVGLYTKTVGIITETGAFNESGSMYSEVNEYGETVKGIGVLPMLNLIIE